ncbi:glycosyltransferase family 4 protein [Paeniglutamicibacter sulfureus]|uniref:glycosyltransferase family 4 protein n=1 Tax=Paeniglutamicibacter sulfureus TaxID=43666 RepID=UPI0026660CE9|nr:glycosyltransferase family 4 protein [Paeniglutamicibacter sulfureus]MDO2935958.1 glycosyltransferase family 4 protein [Paeniglutamicibacter sulfureus]
MRIGIIAPPWLTVPPEGYGGTETVIDVLARGLAALGHEVLLAAASGSASPVALAAGSFPPDPRHLGRTQDELRHVINAYRRLDGMEIIHDNTLAGPLLMRASGAIPVVSTAHNPMDALTLPIYRAIAGHASLLAISRHQATSARGVDICRVIHHGIDADSIPLGTGSGGYACFLGRMHPNKGVLTAIEVARRAGVPLRIAAKMASTGEHEYFTQVIRPKLGGDIEYVGELRAGEKFRLLGESLALLNPLQWAEPFGMVMIEAMATGTPVLCTSRGSAPEIVADGVTGFIRDTPRALAAALPECAHLKRQDCRASTETIFSARRMALEHVDFYERCLAREPDPCPVPV